MNDETPAAQRDARHLSDADVHDYVDGRLDPAAAARAASHRATCASCDAELRATEAVLGWARQSRGTYVAPPELWPLVVARTSQYAAVRRAIMRQLRLPLLAGALLLVIVTAALAVGVTRWRVNVEPVRTLERRLDRARQREEVARQRAADVSRRAPAPPRPPRAPVPQ